MLLLWIAAGGFIGAIARYRLTGAVDARIPSRFPWGTLSVNLLGSFVLGLVLPGLLLHAPDSSVRALVTVGILGSFTTFSSFAFEVTTLLEERRWVLACAYVGASLLLGLLCILFGLLLGQSLA
jgi:fluoride exporter